MNPKPKILLHKDELKSIGIDIKSLSLLTDVTHPAHRDDHFMFIIQAKGSSTWELDFNTITLESNSLCYVAPGQVHRNISSEKPEGWLFFVDPSFALQQYREVFDTFLNSNQYLLLDKNEDLFELVVLLQKWLESGEALLKAQMLTSLTKTIVGWIAQKILTTNEKRIDFEGSKYVITAKFKQLIQQKFREYKQVKEYADFLNITPLYLNEAIKKITGFAASYWIHQEIILEAKRLLQYTDLNITAVAYELGYDDYAYFSRFFKKNTGTTPLHFRNRKP